MTKGAFVNPALFALARRFDEREINEHAYIFELGKLHASINETTREQIEQFVESPFIPAERPPFGEV